MTRPDIFTTKSFNELSKGTRKLGAVRGDKFYTEEEREIRGEGGNTYPIVVE
jgi:hypothetical protein